MMATSFLYPAAYAVVAAAACAAHPRPSVISTAAQVTTTPFVADSAARAIRNLARHLEESFVYPDKGRAYATLLRTNLAAGAYAEFPSAEAFARHVTLELQALHPEGHLRLIPPGETPATSPSAGVPNAGEGIVHVGWAAPSVGYMSIHGYQGTREDYQRMMARLRTALDTLASAKTLIIDARYYLGGAIEETDIVASYLFADSVALLDFDTRLEVDASGGSPLVEGPTMRRVDAPEGIVRRRQVVVPLGRDVPLRSAKVYILTSRRTASGGEGFTLAFKRTGRAIVIGERTAGAGHFGGTRPLGGGYRAFIPVGRPFDPVTGKGWELTGIEPDVRVPAANALDEALRRAGVNPQVGRRALSLPADFEAALLR